MVCGTHLCLICKVTKHAVKSIMKQTVPFKGTHQSIRISSSKQKLQCSDSYSSRRKHLNSGSISSRFNTLLRKHMRHSVNRPPTPDARDDQDQEPTLQEIINIKLIESGEKERLMELLRERLIECGWKDDMRALCRAFIKKKGSNNVTVDDLVHVITPKGRASVPDSIKAELLQRIRTFLVSVAL